MQKRIWKYPFEVACGPHRILMPSDAKVLHVEAQHGNVCLWAIVGDPAHTTLREFCVFGTGEAFDAAGLEYRGTALVGAFVWHVFEAV